MYQLVYICTEGMFSYGFFPLLLSGQKLIVLAIFKCINLCAVKVNKKVSKGDHPTQNGITFKGKGANPYL